jgi:hypothetical protein
MVRNWLLDVLKFIYLRMTPMVALTLVRVYTPTTNSSELYHTTQRPICSTLKTQALPKIIYEDFVKISMPVSIPEGNQIPLKKI